MDTLFRAHRNNGPPYGRPGPETDGGDCGPAAGPDWTRAERETLRRLSSPHLVQRYLNGLAYNPSRECRSPRQVMRRRAAHCLEGALFAGAAMREQGFPALLMDLRAEHDDDHVIAVFRTGGRWGAVAKSNFATLGYREPVYRTLRELAMSYFDFYCNTLGEKTLRAYSRPLDLAPLDGLGWATTDHELGWLAKRLDRVRHYPLLAPGQERSLAKMDERPYAAGLLGAVEGGLYAPVDK
jgi:hypothetical protein